MFAQLRRGRAWRGCPKPRRRSWLRKQSAQALLWRLDTSGLTGPARLEGFLVETRSAAGETLERRLWAFKAKSPGLPGFQNGFPPLSHQWPSTTVDWAFQRSL